MYDLTVIIPTRNEVKALPHLLKTLTSSLDKMSHKIIIIDDGDDNTPQIIRDMHEASVMFYRRTATERNGLAGAILKGFTMAKADSRWVAVMDGDGQHPAENIRRMLWKAETEKLDMVMASRYAKRGCNDGLDGRLRKSYSTFLRQLPRVIFFPKLKRVTDPLGGCFLIRTAVLDLEPIRAIGWKISLEVLLFSPIKRYGEISYTFLPRSGGQSKAGFTVGLQYLLQLASLAFRYFTFVYRRQPCQQSVW